MNILKHNLANTHTRSETPDRFLLLGLIAALSALVMYFGLPPLTRIAQSLFSDRSSAHLAHSGGKPERWELVREEHWLHAAPLESVFFTQRDKGWALTWAELGQLRDQGKTWIPVLTSEESDRAFYSFTFTSPDSGFVVGVQKKSNGYTAMILRTSDGGDTWEERPTNVRLEPEIRKASALLSVSFCDQKIGWAAGDNLILHTTDGGESWQQQQGDSKSGERLVTVACVNADRASIVGSGGLLLRTNNGGDTWTRQDLGLGAKDHLIRVRFFGNEGWIVGGREDTGLLFRTRDSGETWQSQKLDPSTPRLFDVFFLGSSGWIAGQQGTLLHSENAGQNWVRQAVPTTESLTSLFFLSPDQGWIGGERGTLLRLTR